MNDSIRAMSLEFARDPDSLVFLRLGEALRLRGELDAASSVALAGLDRYPELPEARDLYARVLIDRGHPREARQVWEGILERDGRHVGANKGLGFLFYTEGDMDRALDHLETALAVDPTNESVVQALRLVRTAAEELPAEADDATDAGVFAGLEAAGTGILLVDDQARVLGGGVESAPGDGRSEAVAAYLTGAAQEAERTSRILELGTWDWLLVESEQGNVHLTRPTAHTQLMVVRDRSVPTGRLAFVAERANDAARVWLEQRTG